MTAIEYLDSLMVVTFALKKMRDKLTELLPTEREQINQAYADGIAGYLNDENGKIDYYEKTYQNETDSTTEGNI